MTEYKNKVLFLRRSKAGKHLFAFNRDGILGGDVGSIVLNVSEVEDLLAGKWDWIKISAMPVSDDPSAEKTEKISKKKDREMAVKIKDSAEKIGKKNNGEK